jgi:hypothetical protein
MVRPKFFLAFGRALLKTQEPISDQKIFLYTFHIEENLNPLLSGRSDNFYVLTYFLMYSL